MRNFCLALCLLFLSTAYALPSGDPTEASFFYEGGGCFNPWFRGRCFGAGIGFDGNYVYNRHMETVNNKDIDTTRLFTNAGYLVVNFYERIDVFTALGTTRLSLNTSLGAFNVIDPHPLFELESASAFSYRVGGRATLCEYCGFALGVVGQYFATSPNVKRLYIAAGAVSYPGNNLRTRYSEWQVGGGLSYRFNEFFVPYAAVRYANSFWKLNDGNRVIIETNVNNFLHNLRNQRNWGYAIGLTLCPFACERAAVTVEARFPDEKAFYVNGQIRY